MPVQEPGSSNPNRLVKKKLPAGISVKETADGVRYRARIHVDGVLYHLGVYRTLTDAKAALSIAHGQKARGEFIPPAVRRAEVKRKQQLALTQQITLEAYAEKWLDALANATPARSPGTIRSYSSTLNAHSLNELGSLRLIEITPSHVERIVIKAGGSGSGAGNNIVRTLRALFNSAIKDEIGGVTVSPVQVKIKKKTHQRSFSDSGSIATPDEVRALAALMPAELSLAVPLAAWLSLRLGEVLGVQRGDFVNLDNVEMAHLRIERQWNTKASPPCYTPPKYGSERVVSIPSALIGLITEHLRLYTPADPKAPLFPSARNPKVPVSQTALDGHWRAARDVVKPGFVFHKLRHTGLTAYAQAGASQKEIMLRGGHTDVNAAMIYQHSDLGRDRELTNRLNERLAGGSL